MTIIDAFKLYKAILKNIYWSVCAENSDGELIISLWEHHFNEPCDNTILYKDNISRRSGLGRDELRMALDKAKATNQVIRAVIAHNELPRQVRARIDAAKFKNTYSVRENWIGRLEVWDGNYYEIKFHISNKPEGQ